MKTLKSINELAVEKKLVVIKCSQLNPTRKWYGIGSYHDGRFHQVCGATTLSVAEVILSSWGK